MTKGMNGLPREIFQKWMHSFEEDTGDVTVYRPTEYQFPRARGRAGIEFRLDGTFIDWVIGPADASSEIKGHWHVINPGYVRISFEGNIRAPRVLEIVECNASRLTVRHHPDSR